MHERMNAPVRLILCSLLGGSPIWLHFGSPGSAARSDRDSDQPRPGCFGSIACGRSLVERLRRFAAESPDATSVVGERKLLTILNAMVRDGTTWNPALHLKDV